VDQLITVGIDAESSERSLRIARRNDCYASAGVHPNSGAEFSAEVRRRIEVLLGDERVVAVGETGLDFYRDRCPHDVQRRSFIEHIELAHRYDKALIVHTRDSVDAALDTLEAAGPPRRLVFHCWSGNAAQLKRALDADAYVSFAGNVSFKNAEPLRAIARQVPPDRLLIETDSPFLAPAPHRGKPNEPAMVADVGAAVASALDVTTADISTVTATNAARLFGLS
jgi:TatD DNase family protein